MNKSGRTCESGTGEKGEEKILVGKNRLEPFLSSFRDFSVISFIHS